MNFGLLRFPFPILTACAVYLCMFLEAAAQQPSASQTAPIEFSVPSSNSIISDLNKSILGDSTQEGIEDLLGGQQSDSIRPSSRTPAPIVRPQTPSLRSKQLMNLLEKRKDWVFNEPTEKDFGMTPEQIFEIPDHDIEQLGKKGLSAMERYYNRQNDTGKNTKPTIRSDDDDNSSSFKPFQPGNAWTSLFGSSQDNASSVFDRVYADQSAESGSGLSAFQYNSGGQSPAASMGSAQRQRVRDARREEFKKLLDPSYESSLSINMPGNDIPGNPASKWSQADSWGQSSPRPAISQGFGSDTTTIKKPEDDYTYVSRPQTAFNPAVTTLETPEAPSLFPSLTPALQVEEKPRKTMPPPVFQMPKPHF